MQHWWIAQLNLFLVCGWGVFRLISTHQTAAYLVAITLFLLGLNALIGALKYGLQLQLYLDTTHYYIARAFGVSGLYLMCMGLLDWIGWLRLHQRLWLAHLADALLIFFIAFWLEQLPNTQLLLSLVTNLLCLLIAATLWRRGRPIHGQWLAFAALLFLLNGLVVRGGSDAVMGWPIRMDVFHLMLALWVFCITQVVVHPSDSAADNDALS